MATQIWRDLKVTLTHEEWCAAASACSNEEQVLDAHKAALKEATSDFKDKIADSEKKIRDLNEKVRTHKETRAVECFERHDRVRFVVDLHRCDTGEMVESRPMNASERHAAVQPRLPGTEEREGLESVRAFYGQDSVTGAQMETLRRAAEAQPSKAIGTSPSIPAGPGSTVKVEERDGVVIEASELMRNLKPKAKKKSGAQRRKEKRELDALNKRAEDEAEEV